jgi:phosphatidylserine/phosphatidylglycerophosphate/cardiolipin synthase-like enzyme
MIVIDPAGLNCKVITGSHNFSKAASVQNDENSVVIEGNGELAEAYQSHAWPCMSITATSRTSSMQDKSPGVT